MMGGEFCGNAARSFGLYVAHEEAASGGRAAQGDASTVTIEISGTHEPLEVLADWKPGATGMPVTGRAETAIPKPIGCGSMTLRGRSFPVYFFEGITHVIAEGLSPERDLFFEFLAAAKGAWHHFDACPPAAFGVMFYDPEQRFMRPAVYVEATGSLVFESSCGSGTAALAAWMAKDTFNSDDRWAVAQPGGVIEGRVKKQAGEIVSITIGGPVTLGPRRSITV
jgi:diaminopimelate epimerase